MKARWSVLLLLSFAVLGGPDAAEARQRPHLAEQTHFSAEDSGMRKPVPIPKAVLDILIKDETVLSVLEN